jgi:DNA-binding transcriptional LysR family regulator
VETKISSSLLIRRLRFKQLALIAALGESRNLHRAAAAMHLSQPGATKLIHDMEVLLGFPLFERLPRGMVPTDLGETVVAYARRLLADLDRFTEDLEDKRRGGYGQLNVGAIMGAAPDVVARAVTDIKGRRPLLAVRLLGETSDELLNLLVQRKIELAVGRFSAAQQHNEISFEALGNEILYLVVRPKHPLCRAKSIKLRSLNGCAWVLMPLSAPSRQIIEQEFGQLGMASPTDVIECSSIFATLQLVQKSDAITMLPESVVRDHLKARLLVRLPVKVGKNLPGFGIMTRRDEPLSAVAMDFADCLRRYGAQMEQRLLTGRR